uniref:Uncharacterized protein n=1 Tax=Guillardia theta TaxID=55529 RepID=A0A7S4URV5_GUITH
MAARAARTLLRMSREKRDEEMEYISLRMLADCENGKSNVKDNAEETLRPNEFLSFQALVLASRVANSVLNSAGRTYPSGHLKKFVTDLTMFGCKIAYNFRDEGFPSSALRVLKHSLAAIRRVKLSDTSYVDRAAVHLYNDVCNVLRNFGRTAEAKGFCAAAIDLTYKNIGFISNSSLSKFQFNLGKVYSDEDDWENAVVLWRKALEAMEDVDTLISLGMAYSRQGEAAEALAFFKRAFLSDPSHPFPFVAAATTLMRQGDHFHARELLRWLRQPEGEVGYYHDLLRVREGMTAEAFPSSIVWHDDDLHQLKERRIISIAQSDQSLSAAIVYLTSKADEDIQDLNQSLNLLEKNYFTLHRYYPVYVFYDFLEESTILQLNRPNLNISFHKINMDVPSDQQDKHGNFSRKFLGYGLGYRAMCRFFSGPIYNHPAMQSLDFYMRLDVDSFFIAPLPLDPIQHLADRQQSYGYITTGREERKFVVNLWETFMQEATRLKLPNLPAVGSQKAWGRTFFYTNFEVSAMAVWRSQEYLAIFKALDDSGGFFRHRWGDGPVHYLAVRAMLEDSKVVRFNTLPYWHQTLVVDETPFIASV